MTFTDLIAAATQIRDEVTAGANTANRIGSMFLDLLNYWRETTGWGAYIDTQYSNINPFTLSEDTQVVMPNNAGSKLETQKPPDIATFYDETIQKIPGRTDDGIAITVAFKAKPLSASANVRIQLSIFVGGTVGEAYAQEYALSKGNGVEHKLTFNGIGFQLDNWAIQGGELRIIAFNSDVAIYDIFYVLTRSHKAVV